MNYFDSAIGKDLSVFIIKSASGEIFAETYEGNALISYANLIKSCRWHFMVANASVKDN